MEHILVMMFDNVWMKICEVSIIYTGFFQPCTQLNVPKEEAVFAGMQVPLLCRMDIMPMSEPTTAWPLQMTLHSSQQACFS
mmetsp:Transcript_34131/g.61180  ORF Transcript_34131/g.61180 Transcript_34131/m.61180 type:complete len:81 (-) Transcript_34131:1082-1324(-)